MAGSPPKKNAAYIFYSSLVDSSNRPDFKDTPTLAAGDFKVSTDGGALGNLATLPTNTPGGVMLKFSLSADEMNGDDITVVCIDAAGVEWDDILFNIQTSEFQIGADLVDAIWDEVLTAAAHNVASSSGRRLRTIQEGSYEGGAVWIDTVNGAAGTTDFENGTVENPVSNIADANTLATSLGLVKFVVLPGSTITFAAAQNNQLFTGHNWTLALGGQDVAGTMVAGATVSGIAAGTGTRQIFKNCFFNAATLIAETRLITCGIMGTITVGEAGDYFMDRCHSGIAGTTTWIFDFGDAIGATNLNVRSYSGGIQIESMGDTGTDSMSLEGHGQLIEGTCTSGTIAVRGHFTVSGITNLTLSDDARMDINQIQRADVRQWLGAAVTSLDAATVSTAASSATITQYRGDDWLITLTALGSITGNTEVWFTIKRRQVDTDAQAAVILSDGTGLEIINGAAGTAGNGTLTVDDASAGDITMTLKAVETAKLAVGAYKFDVQWKDGAGLITTIADGAFTVIADKTLAVS